MNKSDSIDVEQIWWEIENQSPPKPPSLPRRVSPPRVSPLISNKNSPVEFFSEPEDIFEIMKQQQNIEPEFHLPFYNEAGEHEEDEKYEEDEENGEYKKHKVNIMHGDEENEDNEGDEGDEDDSSSTEIYQKVSNWNSNSNDNNSKKKIFEENSDSSSTNKSIENPQKKFKLKLYLTPPSSAASIGMQNEHERDKHTERAESDKRGERAEHDEDAEDEDSIEFLPPVKKKLKKQVDNILTNVSQMDMKDSMEILQPIVEKYHKLYISSSSQSPLSPLSPTKKKQPIIQPQQPQKKYQSVQNFIEMLDSLSSSEEDSDAYLIAPPPITHSPPKKTKKKSQPQPTWIKKKKKKPNFMNYDTNNLKEKFKMVNEGTIDSVPYPAAETFPLKVLKNIFNDYKDTAIAYFYNKVQYQIANTIQNFKSKKKDDYVKILQTMGIVGKTTASGQEFKTMSEETEKEITELIDLVKEKTKIDYEYIKKLKKDVVYHFMKRLVDEKCIPNVQGLKQLPKKNMLKLLVANRIVSGDNNVMEKSEKEKTKKRPLPTWFFDT